MTGMSVKEMLLCAILSIFLIHGVIKAPQPSDVPTGMILPMSPLTCAMPTNVAYPSRLARSCPGDRPASGEPGVINISITADDFMPAQTAIRCE